jgi:tRNA dimethylallyltransferase
MESTTKKPELIVVVGPTASGKSDLALKIAQNFNGEIIAADSRTIYKGMDIGTAKPTKQEQELVPHWGIDLVEPGVAFSAYQFKKYAENKIVAIQKRGKLPIIVGGSGLYIDSVIFDFEFSNPADKTEREQLEKLSLDELQSIIKARGFALPENILNRRHLIRTIERKGETGSKRSLKNNTLIIGLDPGTETLKARIKERVDNFFEQGFISEVEQLLDKYGEQRILKTRGIGYGVAIKYIKGEITQQEAKNLFRTGDWQYARRQRTWFKRNKFIHWYESVGLAYKEIVHIMNN